MNHIFIVNPAAGRGVLQKRLIEELRRRGLGFYLTECSGDAERYARSMCGESGGKSIRFYACGGDGTLNEVINGVFGFDNAEAACFPVGSGNDFIRNFDVPVEYFMDIDKQLAGAATLIDVMRYRELADGPASRYAVNMFNTGFDCNVVANMERFKKYPLVGGSLAYFLSVLYTLVRKEGADLEIGFEDGTYYNGHVLFTAIGNGSFCGGGLKGIPYAELDDGLMDVSVVKDIPRRRFVSLFKKYANGTYIEEEALKALIIYKKCRSLSVKNMSAARRMCVDGEIIAADEVEFEIMPGALRFSLPTG